MIPVGSALASLKLSNLLLDCPAQQPRPQTVRALAEALRAVTVLPAQAIGPMERVVLAWRHPHWSRVAFQVGRVEAALRFATGWAQDFRAPAGVLAVPLSL
jgi:predicted phosphatase